MSVRIRYFAAAKAALGVGEEQRDAAGLTIGALMAELVAATSSGLSASSASHAPDAMAAAAVLDRCSFLLNRRATTDRATVLRDGDDLDVLPPFAGG